MHAKPVSTNIWADSNLGSLAHFETMSKINWGCPDDLLTNQMVLDPTVHCHTSRAAQVGIEPTSPPTKVVALPTKPQIPQR